MNAVTLGKWYGMSVISSIRTSENTKAG